ncbi:hypothetical protein [Pseudodonghicola xiamenensis]|nr:hypothetical protein [Pseudodonghicola xiamenensis]
MTKTIFAAAALAALPALAWAWRAQNRHEVHDLGQGVFEVVSEVGAGAGDYWCGAGDYAIAALRTPANQRIYIWKPLGPSVSRPGRKAVQFALTPPQGADTSVGLSLAVKRAGDNLTAAMARNYCYDRVEDRVWHD